MGLLTMTTKGVFPWEDSLGVGLSIAPLLSTVMVISEIVNTVSPTIITVYLHSTDQVAVINESRVDN